MTAATPPIHGKNRFVSASMMLDAMGRALFAIRNEDHLSYADMGQALGKSEDQVAKYCSGTAAMDAPTFLRACSVWNGRFSSAVFSLIGQYVAPSDAQPINCQTAVIDVTRFLLDLQIALADRTVNDSELSAMRGVIEAAGQIIDGLRARLAALSASA
jgi:transcriptional regulator with XRE-family HTH domain